MRWSNKTMVFFEKLFGIILPKKNEKLDEGSSSDVLDESAVIFGLEVESVCCFEVDDVKVGGYLSC